MLLHSALEASTLHRPQGGVLRVPGQLHAPCRSSRYAGRRRRSKPVCAAAKVAGDTDLVALLSDALQTGSSKGSSATESAGKAASRAVEQAPASGGAVDRIAGSGLQPLQDPQQAGSAANQALKSAEQAVGSAAQQTPSPPPPAAKVAGDTDLGALLSDALQTGSSKGPSAAESAGKAASKAVEQAPASGGAVDRIAGSGLQPLQDPQQAGSAANQALKSAEQAVDSAVQKASSPPPSAAKQALSSAKQAVESSAQNNPSPSPPAAQQAADSAAEGVKEQAYSTLQSAQQGGGGDGGGATSQAARALSESAPSASSAGSGGGAVEQGLSSAADAAPSSGPDALSQLTDGMQSTVTAAQDTAADVLQSIKGAAAGLLDSGKSATSGLTSGLNDVTSGLLESASSLREAADSGLAAAQSTASGLLSGVDEVTGGVQGQAAQLLSNVQAATAELTASANSAATSAVESLPPPVQDALLQAKSVASQAAMQVTDLAGANPDIAKAAAVPLIGGPALIWLAGRFGGFKGPLPPSKAYDILQKEDALLVDIRGDAERAAQGVPDLQRNALGKGAIVPLDAINTAPASKLRRAKQVSTDVVALTISQLRAVGRGTKVILMDRGDGRAVPIAKRLNKFGVRSVFVVEGGFRQWQRSGVAVRDDRDDYKVSQLQLLGTRTSIAAEETAAAFRKPVSIVLGGAALALAAGVLIDWRRTLQYIGTGGLLFTALLRTTSYSRPQDLLDDVSSISNTVGAPLAAIAGTTKVFARKVQDAASGEEGPAEVLTQPVQPTQPVSEVAAGRAQEEPVQMPDVDTGASSGGESEGSSSGGGAEQQTAQLP